MRSIDAEWRERRTGEYPSVASTASPWVVRAGFVRA
jgi:hypothetical protein